MYTCVCVCVRVGECVAFFLIGMRRDLFDRESIGVTSINVVSLMKNYSWQKLLTHRYGDMYQQKLCHIAGAMFVGQQYNSSSHLFAHRYRS